MCVGVCKGVFWLRVRVRSRKKQSVLKARIHVVTKFDVGSSSEVVVVVVVDVLDIITDIIMVVVVVIRTVVVVFHIAVVVVVGVVGVVAVVVIKQRQFISNVVNLRCDASCFVIVVSIFVLISPRHSFETQTKAQSRKPF